jgi:catechol 2,3-dioxygenase-like lactoylglutathione lyase family enzyme
MIAHTGINVPDYKKGKEFYKKALAPLGYKLHMDYAKWKAGGFMQGGQTDFWISEGEKGAPMHVAFRAKNKKQVNDFYAAALEAGAKDNGAPGYRKDYSPGYYAAFVYDAGKNNIEAVWYDPKPKK